jgi:tRNA nucleotidyltransferase (CCA-adding enzyme)
MTESLSKQLEKYLPPPVLALVKIAGKDASKLGQELYIVGGVVRDLFLGRANFDFDLVVEGDAIVLARKLAKESQAKLTIHSRFGTAKLLYPDFSIDLATARRETYSRPGALPTVEPGSLKDDLIRRDFSINAMALHLNSQQFGELVDLYNGRDDMEHRLIKILHPKSFIDDATRILRALRYEQRLGFKLEMETERLLRRDAAMFDAISGDRLRHELDLILKEDEPEHILRRAEELGVLGRLHPSLKGNDRLANTFARARQVDKRTTLSNLYLCLLIYNLREKQVEEFISRFNFPKNIAEALKQTLQLKTQLHELANAGLKPSHIYRLLHGYSVTTIQANAMASESPIATRYLNLYLNKLRYVKPILNGDDLQRLGIASGPKIKEALAVLQKAKLDGEVKTRLDEERLVHKGKTMETA